MTTPADRVAAHNAGRHEQAADPLCVLCEDAKSRTPDLSALEDKYYEAVAKNLREFGYPDVTRKEVKEQMAKPEGERNVIGMMAASMLRDHFEDD